MEARLNVSERSGAGKGVARKLRRAGRVPGVIYGGGEEPLPVSVDAREALTLFQSISVENTILRLFVDNGESGRALVREVQTHPYRTELLHIDFLRIQRGVPIEVQVPIRLVGTPAGVREAGGMLDQLLHDMAVKCVPSRIPDAIELDVSALQVGDMLRGRDIPVPEEVESLLDPDRAVCGVAAPRVAAELEEEGDEEAALAGEGLAGQEPG